jgi:hypothetical protein
MTNEITFTHKTNSYPVKFPNAGQFWDIQLMKASLSNGLYGSVMKSLTKDGDTVLDWIDMEATFRVLVPDLFKKGLKVDSLKELEIEDLMALWKDYNSQVVPFMIGVRSRIDELVKKGQEKTNE